MPEFETYGLVENCRSDRVISDTEQPIVLHCGTGERSALAAPGLDSMGDRYVSSMSGGIIAWAAARLPLDLPV